MSRRLAEQSGDIYSEHGHTCHGLFCYGRGAFEEAIENLSRCCRFGERIDFSLCFGMHTIS